MMFIQIGRNILLVSLMLILQSIILLLFAKATECSIVPLSAGSDLVLVSTILSIAAIAYVTMLKSNDMKFVFITAVLYFLFVFFLSVLKNGFLGNESYYMKLMICVVCGEMIGSFFGSHRHNRLRNSSKRRSLTTK